jgi:hypothetical protein
MRRVGTTANTTNHSTLDAGNVANELGFWKKIEAAFKVSKYNYNILQFQDDDVFASETLLYPGKIFNHDWKKLRSMWKGVNAEYKAALTQFTQSGPHDSSFYSFCSGKKEDYYLRLLLAD